jgi:hypothetical protein
MRCREDAAPMARKRREAVVIARDRERERERGGGAEAIADMGCHGHHQASRTARREKRGFLAC